MAIAVVLPHLDERDPGVHGVDELRVLPRRAVVRDGEDICPDVRPGTDHGLLTRHLERRCLDGDIIDELAAVCGVDEELRRRALRD